MHTIYKNFVTSIKRFKTSVILNIVGLSVAFAVFTIIMLQVSFELGYEKYNPKSDRVYRAYLKGDDRKQAVWSQPLIDMVSAISPHIKGASLLEWSDGMEAYLEVTKPDGGKEVFKSPVSVAYPAIVSMLNLKIVEGPKNPLLNPNTYLIPQSLARKCFGSGSALGKKLGNTPVGGVYEDLPSNSIIGNLVYYSVPATQAKNSESNYNYMFLIELDNPSSKAAVQELMSKKLAEYFKGKGQVDMGLTSLQDVYFEKDIAYDFSAKGSQTSVNVFIAIAFLIILIASINYVNFASALTPLRIKMINVQKILGGSTALLRLSLLVESVIITLFSFGVGLLLLMLIKSTSMVQSLNLPIDLARGAGVLLGVGGFAVVIGLIAGLYPAYYMTSFTPIFALKGSFGMSATGRKYRSLLISIQYIISIALIIVSLFVNIQNRFIGRYSIGFNKSEVVIATVNPNNVIGSMKAIQEKLKQQSGVVDVAFAQLKFGGTESYMGWGRNYKNRNINFNVLTVTPNFLKVLGVKVAEGRDFWESDSQLPYASAIFNQEAKLKDTLKVNDVIGDIVTLEDNSSFKIVGFADESLRTLSLRQKENPFCFLTWGTKGWTPPLPYVYIRLAANTDKVALIEKLRGGIESINPSLAPSFEFMDTVTDQLYQKELRIGKLVSLFSFIAIIISLMGVFGLVLFETQYRRKEIGIRRVHGASIAEIIKMLNIKFIRIVLICFVVASPIAYYAVKQWLNSFVLKIPIEWWVFAVALLIVLLITVITVTIRSYKTATEDPSTSIKTE